MVLCRDKSEKLSGCKGDFPRKPQLVAAHGNLSHQAATSKETRVLQNKS